MSDTFEPPGVPARAPTWSRLQELFHALQPLDAAERGARLTSLEAEDAALAEELRSLLAADAAAEGYLESPATFAPAASPGDRLGPWRIVDEIGRGGMGVVFRAEREGGDFRQQVAIKLVEPGMRSDRILSRFRAERRILARLAHPNIARLVDGGTAPDGSPFLAMEYVEGQPLLEWCDTHGLDVDARLELFLTVCAAVSFAHQQLVIHRDLKSDNILVTADGAPHLLDFGIAKLVAPDAAEDEADATVALHRLLTPDYASPEHVRGDPVGVAGDVYSLGVVLFELLTGARPLRFRTRTPEEILRVVTQDEPVRPSAAIEGPASAPRRRRLAGDLDDIVLKALEKDPSRRYASVAELADDLRRHLDGRPVLARGPSAAYRMSRFVRRHRAAVTSGVLLVAALVAGLVTTTWQAGLARRERDRATRRFDDVRQLAHTVVFELHDAIAEIPGSTRARELLVRRALQYLDRLAVEAGSDPSLQRELAQAYARIGDAQGRPMFASLGRTGDALASFRRSLALYDEASRAWPDSVEVRRERIVVSQRMADILGVMGRLADAKSVLLDGQQRLGEMLARDPESRSLIQDMGVACDRLSDIALAEGDTAAALAELRRGIREMDRSFARSPHDPDVRRSRLIGQMKLAQLFTAWRRPDSAQAHLRLAGPLALEAVAEQPDHLDAARDLSIYWSLLAFAYSAGGQVDSALSTYERAMRISEQLAARDSDSALQQEDLAVGDYEIGCILRDGGRHAAAAERFERAVSRWTTVLTADTANARSRLSLAQSLREAGEAWRVAALATPGRTGDAVREQRARVSLTRALVEFRALDAAGAIPGEERNAPAWLAKRLAELAEPGRRAKPAQPAAPGGPDNSR